MKKWLLIAVVLVLSISGAVYAQGIPAGFCGDLAQADCDILTHAQEASKSLDSAAFNFEANVTLANMPSMTAPVTISVTGNGAVTGVSKAQTDLASVQSDPTQAILGVLDNIDLDFSLTVTIPPELMASAPKGTPNSVTLQTKLVDGVGYLNLDSLAALMGSSGDSGMKGWNGLDLAGLFRALIKQSPQLFSGMMAGGSSSAMQTYMQQFTNPDFLKQFLTIQRTDDGSGDTATFAFTFDFAALMSNPALQDMIRQQMQTQMQAQGQTMTDAQIQQALDMSTQIFQGMTMNMTEEVGITDGYIHAINGTLAMDMSGMMSALGTSDTSGSTTAAPSVNVDFSYTASNFDSVPPITAPEGATVIPYDSILSMISSMTGMMTGQQSG